jgi:uncharacterized membrane protein YoaK (UPF0700 family)
MFRHQGPSRSDRQNRLLAGYLAFVGGFVNSVGFVLLGAFTSHVTGNVGRLANDLAYRRYDAAAAVLPMLLAFFVGAFLAGMTVESNFFERVANAYGTVLLCEATLLLLFIAVSPSIEAVLLGAAMGMQNSLVTRLSGAVVRTTHLTGVVTDLGIEGARWFRWWRGSLSRRVGIRLTFGQKPPERPHAPKALLLGTIATTFVLGAMAGALLAVQLDRAALLLAGVAVLACAIYAFENGRHAPRDDAEPELTPPPFERP